MGMKGIETVIQEIIDAQNADPFDAEATTDALTDALNFLEKQPEIVRCLDCKNAVCYDDKEVVCTHIDSNGRDTHSVDWFCADGERTVKLE